MCLENCDKTSEIIMNAWHHELILYHSVSDLYVHSV